MTIPKYPLTTAKADIWTFPRVYLL